MRNNRFIISILLLIEAGLNGLLAQETIPAAGANVSGSGGSVSFSVGQVVYTSLTGTSGSVDQGVQQPVEISVVNSLEEIEENIGIDLLVSAYPNPATDYLILKVDNLESYSSQTDPSAFSFRLFDIQGTLLYSEILTNIETSISVEDLLPATYFLQVTRGIKEVKTFQIIIK